MVEIYTFAMKFQKSNHRQIFPKKHGRNRWMSVKRYKDSINPSQAWRCLESVKPQGTTWYVSTNVSTTFLKMSYVLKYRWMCLGMSIVYLYDFIFIDQNVTVTTHSIHLQLAGWINLTDPTWKRRVARLHPTSCRYGEQGWDIWRSLKCAPETVEDATSFHFDNI